MLEAAYCDQAHRFSRRVSRIGAGRKAPGESSRNRFDAQTLLPGKNESDPPAMSDDIWRWTATRIATAIRGRDISAREALESCLGRMAAVNAKLNAVTVDQSTSAREAADRADRAVARGDRLGTLHGVPVTIKENVDQQGCCDDQRRGRLSEHRRPGGQPDRRQLEEGRRGHSRPHQYAGFQLPGSIRSTICAGARYSPWSKTHTPGGSSGGAASSVAAGITPLAHGNDIAGSVRFPAYCCGLAGIRPSFGRVPAYNPTQTAERSMSSQLMSVQGPLARSVADVRLGLAAMAERDPRDPWWTPVPLDGPALQPPIRVAVVTEARDLAGVKLHPSVARALDAGRRGACRRRLQIVDARTPGFTRAKELWFEMQMPEFRHYTPAADRKGRRRGHTHRGAFHVRQYSAVAWQRGLVVHEVALGAHAIDPRVGPFLDRVPLVLTPICSEPVYEQGFDIESAARTASLWRECATHDGDSGARAPRDCRCRPARSTGCRWACRSSERAFARTCASRRPRRSRRGEAC